MPADIIARQIAHAEGAHRKPKFFYRAVNLFHRRAFIEHKHRLPRILFDHAIADKAITHTGNHRRLLYLFGKLHHGSQYIMRSLATAYHLKQLHHICRAEKMQPHDILWTLGEAGNPVQIERRSIAGENRARLHHAVELAEYLLFDADILEHSFNDEVGILDIVIAQGRLE